MKKLWLLSTLATLSLNAMEIPKVHIETDRLIVREWNIENDVEPLLAIHQDPGAMSYCHCLSLEQTKKRIFQRQDHFNTYGFGAGAIVIKATQELIGFGGFTVFPGTQFPLVNKTEALVRIHQKYWKQGFAIEAAKALIVKGFTHYALTEIVASVHPNNSNSISLIEKMGLKRDPTKDFYRAEPQQKIPEYFRHFYSITKEEWLTKNK